MSQRRGKVAFIWIAVLALATVIFVKERELALSVEQPEGHDPKWLVPVALEEIGALEILRKGQLHRFERDDKGIWFYHGQQDDPNIKDHAHRADPLAATTIAQAVAMFVRTRKEQPIPLQPGKDEYGVSRPDILIMVYQPKKSEPVARFSVGMVSPNGYSRYVLAVGANEAVTIPEYQITNLMAMIDAVSKNPLPTPAAPSKKR
ncbi:MAG: hypothetical protein RLZ09_2433 [Pseudomonadota bacterium]